MSERKYDDEYYEFLDDLRESGATNMFGAPAYLENAYGIDADEARDIVADWMATYTERHKKEADEVD